MFSSPIYDSLREWLDKLCPDRAPGPEELNALCSQPPLSGGGVPIRFIRPPLAGTRIYADQFEVRTCLRGEIPMRERSWHDAFNALVWLAFPRTKAAINQRHVGELDLDRSERAIVEDETYSPGGRRGASRDAFTLFDESGIIVACANADLLELLRMRAWKTLFWTRRAQVKQQMRFYVFGHALHEKAMHAYKGMTARALVLSVPMSFLDRPVGQQRESVDGQAARYIRNPESLKSAHELPPLPIMGIPEWTANDVPEFYDDAEVFRQVRRS